ncbi:MAG: peptide deformylase [Anaerolineae bacterium]|nr:peptide deformylase [Anaerolineae bacterium]
MAIRKIVIYPEGEKILRKKCTPVKRVRQEARQLAQDLVDTLNAHPEGIGLAAPQIGAQQRIVVVRLGGGSDSEQEPGPPLPLIDPKIVEAGDEKPDFDGCLSLPGLYGKTVRPHHLRITGLYSNGRAFDRVFDGFDAVVVHHELDHLDGVLFIDRISRLEDLYRVQEDEHGEPVRVPLTSLTQV